MRTMGLRAIYPRTSKPGPRHKVYPYLLGGMEIARPNQGGRRHHLYIPMAKGFLYLVAIMDWYSRYVVAWRLSNTLDAAFCVGSWMRRRGNRRSSTPIYHQRRIHRSPQAARSGAWTETIARTVKYEEVYLKAYSGGREEAGLDAYFSGKGPIRPWATGQGGVQRGLGAIR